MGLLGPPALVFHASATESPWTPLSFLQILALLPQAVGPILGLMVLESGSDPLQLLHGMSPEAVTEHSVRESYLDS